MSHIPVLLNEVMQVLDPKPGEFFIDGTVDGGGYACAIVERLHNSGKFFGIDWDWQMIQKVHSKMKECEKRGVQVTFVNDNFARLPELLEGEELGRADGLVLDLGLSSEQLEDSGRGFSFLRDEPLIMTYADDVMPVKDILKVLDEEKLAGVIKEFGEERYAERIAAAIKEREKIKPIETSGDLALVVRNAVPANYERGRIHPATRTFQALRIYANRELENLEKILRSLPSMLKQGGRVAIVSFHSLEDRLVKNYFRDLSKVGKLETLTKKPVTALRSEVLKNPRARSAKLRAARIL